jgi:hypothetical protein
MKQPAAHAAFRFVLIIGLVNLFADRTHEGSRGISGPFLGSPGASATAVRSIAGFGELLGYGLVLQLLAWPVRFSTRRFTAQNADRR